MAGPNIGAASWHANAAVWRASCGGVKSVVVCANPIPTASRTWTFAKNCSKKGLELLQSEKIMIPVGHIAHQLPARVRLRIAEKRGDVAFFEKLTKTLSRNRAIEEVLANPLTGSITIRHSGPFDALAAFAAEQGLFTVAQQQAEPDPAGAASKGAVPKGPVQNGSRPRRDPDIATGLTGLSLVQAARGPVFGSAAENFWYAFGSQQLLGRPDLAVAFAAVGVYQVLAGNLFGSAASLFFYALVMRRYAAIELGVPPPAPRANAAPAADGAGAPGKPGDALTKA